MSNPPNILIISTNHHRADCLGVAGRRVKTPNLDSLSRSGTRFGSCITPSIASQSVRSSVLTGQLCQTHGVHDDGLDLDPEIGEMGFARTLANAGYDTSLFGKANFSQNHPKAPSGTPECAFSSRQYTESWTGPYMGFDHVQLALTPKAGAAPSKPPHGQHYERYFHVDGRGAEHFKRYLSGQKESIEQHESWHSQLPTFLHSTPWTTDRAIDWLRTGHDKKRPFCSWVSFSDPQAPYDCPQPWSLLHDPEGVDMPAHRTPNTKAISSGYQAALGKTRAMSKPHNDKLTIGQQDNLFKQIIANAYGKISFIDDQIGRLLHALSELGLAKNTHVFYHSDQGDWLGDNGHFATGPTFHDSMLRVPLIWKGPDVPKKRIVYEPVSTLDLSPTLLQLAGVTPQLTQHGACLQPLLNGATKREFALSEWELLSDIEKAKFSLRCVRTRTYRLTKDMNTGQGELYDLLSDPHQTRNLFDDPTAAGIRLRLESYLKLRTQDAGIAKAA